MLGKRVPFWVSFKTYKFRRKQRTYISNEKTHDFFVFDGIASKLWDLISKGATDFELRLWASKNGIKDDFDDFLAMLQDLDLIENSSPHKKEVIIEQANSTTYDEKEAINFLAKKSNNLIKNNYLGELVFELTYKCNLLCEHCYNDKDINSVEEISFEEAKTIIDEASSLGVSSIILTGGECTVAKDFLKIARYIREKRISLEIFTNGQLLYDNEKLFTEIVSLYPYRVSLSLYSTNPDIHEKITKVKGSHAKTISVIKKLKEQNILVGIKCFLTSVNANSYSEVSKFATENGCSMTLDCNFIDNPTRQNQHMKVTEEQLFDIYTNRDSSLRIKSVLYKNSTNFKTSSICSVGKKMLTITPSLEVVCCPSFKKKVGDLKVESLSEIWNSQDKNSELNKIKKLIRSSLKECYTKDYCKYCLYCVGSSFYAGKYLKKYEEFCRTAKIRMEAAKLNRKIDRSK